MILKIITYYLVSFIRNLYGKYAEKHEVQGVWAVLVFVDAYLFAFFFLPFFDIISFDFGALIKQSRYNSFWVFIPLTLLEGIYLFWDDRYIKIRNEIKEMDAKIRWEKAKNIIWGLIIYTALSCVYMYYNFSFGRW